MSLISTALAPDDIFGRHSQDNSMRNVIYAINLTLDGCCDHTKFNPPDDDEVLEHYTHLLRDFDLLVYGRKTYQLMVPYWPDIAKSQSERAATRNQTYFRRPNINCNLELRSYRTSE